MAVCFRTGQSLLQTMQQVGAATKGPVGALFCRAAHLLETGGSTHEALSVFQGRGSVPELAFVSVALDVQHQTGGSMERVLDAARDTVEGELELTRSLRVQTAQAKLSARIVSVMPIVLIALFSLVSEDFLAPFFSSFAGMTLLGIAVVMKRTVPQRAVGPRFRGKRPPPLARVGAFRAASSPSSNRGAVSFSRVVCEMLPLARRPRSLATSDRRGSPPR